MPAVDKDWGDSHDQQFVNDDPAIWSNKSHRGCFYQQNFMRAVFPSGVTGAELYGNYDNCVIPAGFTLMDGATNRRIDVQNDFRDWKLNASDLPVEPMDKKRMLRDGESIDPADIPALAILKEKMLKKDFDIAFAGPTPVGKHNFFKATPAIISTEVRDASVEMPQSAFNAMVGNGIFDSAPTRDARAEQGKRILVHRNKDRTKKHLDIYEPVVILKGKQTTYEIEGEVYLFKDARVGSR